MEVLLFEATVEEGEGFDAVLVDEVVGLDVLDVVVAFLATVDEDDDDHVGLGFAAVTTLLD